MPIASLLLAAGLLSQSARGDCDIAPRRVILLMTDDQRFDSLWAMPEVTARLATPGIQFDRAYVTTPLCCPSRASLISGGFEARNTGVLTNELPNGGAMRFLDEDTLVARLQSAGWVTGIFGKYLNEYEAMAPTVPPGWTEFAAMVNTGVWYDFEIIRGSTGVDSAQGRVETVAPYVTDAARDFALDFLDAYADTPFFLFVSFPSPHYPHIPATEDQGAFDGFAYTDRAWNEADLSDKPAFVRNAPPLDETRQEDSWAADRERLECLLSVDRATAAILDRLGELGIADDTLVIFTSDNGILWGEHRLFHKALPYEESVRVPLVVWGEGIRPGTSSSLVAMNLDIAPTVMEIAGLERSVDGRSLLPLLCGDEPAGREGLLMEAHVYDTPSWASFIMDDWKYVAYVTGEEELYDLATDPFEMESRHADPGLAEIRAELAARVEAERGLAILTDMLPHGRVGQYYASTLESWGGTHPLTWTTVGDLPQGLFLDADGTIHGVPEEEADQAIDFTVTDSTVSPYSGEPQSLVQRLWLRVRPLASTPTEPGKEQGCACGSPIVRSSGWAGVLAMWLGWRRRRPTFLGRSAPS